MSVKPPRASGRLVLLLTVAVIVAAALAASAAAEPASTTLIVTAQKATVVWSGTGVLNGALQTTVDPPLPLDQQSVDVQRATSPLGPWSDIDSVTNTTAPYSSGAYTYSFIASRNYYWRMSFAGTAEWALVVSNHVLVRVKPMLSRPSCPPSVKHGKRFTVSGTLKPRFPAGSKTVKVRAYRFSNNKWRLHKGYTATNANSGSYTKYSVRIAISKKGKYRFRASTVATSTYASAASSFSRTLTVK